MYKGIFSKPLEPKEHQRNTPKKMQRPRHQIFLLKHQIFLLKHRLSQSLMPVYRSP